jgi:hypothetical protein
LQRPSRSGCRGTRRCSPGLRSARTSRRTCEVPVSGERHTPRREKRRRRVKVRVARAQGMFFSLPPPDAQRNRERQAWHPQTTHEPWQENETRSGARMLLGILECDLGGLLEFEDAQGVFGRVREALHERQRPLPHLGGGWQSLKAIVLLRRGNQEGH